MTDNADVLAYQRGMFHSTHVCFTVGGAGSTWNSGYQYDLGNALDPDIWTQQGITYPAAAFPMAPSTAAGVAEYARQLELWDCTRRTHGGVWYSEGWIVAATILDRMGITHNPNVVPDLAQYADTFIGGTGWGNPRREQGHTCPGGIDPGGHGIVTPNLVGTPDTVWEFASGKTMVNSSGQDLYATCGYDGNLTSVADEEAIWNIVNNGTLTSFEPLILQVLALFTNPTPALVAAVYAVLDAGLFFVAEGLTPHTSYQTVQPIPGDPRDAWTVALDHMNAIGAAIPARASA